jgi:3D (Asp-Asp-Asp) domain-containing protein
MTMTMLTVSGLVDRKSAAADSDSSQRIRNTVTRVVEVREPVPFDTITKTASNLRIGTSETTRPGVPGVAIVSYRVTYEDDREVSRERIGKRIVKAPVAEVVLVGKASASAQRGRLASRGGYFSGRRVLTMIATGYDPSPASNGGSTRTSTGLRIGHGVVAVDPRIIPIGTRLYIEGYGEAVAADVGSAIKGYRIDLGHDSSRGARNVGRRIVRVHILD